MVDLYNLLIKLIWLILLKGTSIIRLIREGNEGNWRDVLDNVCDRWIIIIFSSNASQNIAESVLYERTLLPQEQQDRRKQPQQQVQQHHTTEETERVSVEQDNRHALELALTTLQQKPRPPHFPLTLLPHSRQPLPIHRPSRPLTRPHKGQHQRDQQEKAKTPPAFWHLCQVVDGKKGVQ